MKKETTKKKQSDDCIQIAMSILQLCSTIVYLSIMWRRLLAKYTIPWMVVSWKNVSKPLWIFCHNSNFPTPDDRTDLRMFSLRLCTASLKITFLFQSTSVFLIFMSFPFSLIFSLPLVDRLCALSPYKMQHSCNLILRQQQQSRLVHWILVSGDALFLFRFFSFSVSPTACWMAYFFVIPSVTIKVFFCPTLLCSQNRLNLLGFVCLFAGF